MAAAFAAWAGGATAPLPLGKGALLRSYMAPDNNPDVHLAPLCPCISAHLGDGGCERRLAVVDVPNRAHIDVRLRAAVDVITKASDTISSR